MRPNGAVPRCVTTVQYYDVIPHTHFRQHFNPISSPKRTVRHAWATLPRLSVARKHSGRPFREQNAPSRSRDILGRLSREQNALFHSRDHLGRLSREQNPPSRSRDNLGRPFREQNTPFRSRDILGRPFREQNTLFCSRDCRERHTRQPRRFFSELRELHGNSTGTLRALLDAAEVRPEPVGLVIGLSAFRNRHLDG